MPKHCQCGLADIVTLPQTPLKKRVEPKKLTNQNAFVLNLVQSDQLIRQHCSKQTLFREIRIPCSGQKPATKHVSYIQHYT